MECPLERYVVFVLFATVGTFGGIVIAAEASPDRDVPRPSIDTLIPLDREPSPGETGVVTDSEGRATVPFFGMVATGTSFVFLVDCSASTGGRGNLTLPLIRAQVERTLRRLDDVHRFGIVVYANEPRWYRPATTMGNLAFATQENRERAIRYLETVRPSGNTDHLRALREATRLHPDVLFWLTDGEEPKLTPTELAELRELAAGTRIYTIEFGTGDEPNSPSFLKIAAQENGGKHRWIDLLTALREWQNRQNKQSTETK